MSESLGSYTLRNKRNVYRDGHRFKVEQVGPKKTSVTTILASTVEHFHSLAKGRVLDAEQAAAILEPHAERLQLPYTYGYKLRFYVQEILIILHLLKRARIQKEGRRYVYTVHS